MVRSVGEARGKCPEELSDPVAGRAAECLSKIITFFYILE